jgi:hypothetical protein
MNIGKTHFKHYLFFRDERIVHVNVGWVGHTGFSAVECEGRTLSSFIDKSKDSSSDFGFKHFQHVFKSLKAFTPQEKKGDISGIDVVATDVPKRDAHSPSSYETSNVFLMKKAKSLSACPNIIFRDFLPSSSPDGVASLIASPFGSPTITRKSSINVSTDSCEVKWDSFRVPFGNVQGLRTQLSTVPIGSKHFAVLCIPVPTSKGGSY